jgi:hypothetical protein
MNLAAAIDFGEACGLETIEECVCFVEMQAMSLFLYPEINAELKELQDEWKAHPEYPEIPRIMQECVECESQTWHRGDVCLRCTRT